jgi:hypothetical protein
MMPQNRGNISGAQNREIGEVARATIDVRADINHDNRILRGWKNRGDSGPVDAFNAAQREQRERGCGAGVSGA